MAFVATASATKTPPRSPASRPNLVSVGTIVWLSSELMFFAALFAMYFTIRSVDKGEGLPWPGAHLDLTLGSINTTVLQFLHNNLPFGGVNNSGIGSSHGVYGFKAFSHERAVLRDHASVTPMLFPPYTRTVRLMIKSTLKYFA